ncbi:hypothetical protein Sjap_019379 [Stephania japonica]|uniref:Uncharacterized protein n=1 Tax=Stephania japonica TaxID=461633 RepID=A0AAP0F1F8_9MAGN
MCRGLEGQGWDRVGVRFETDLMVVSSRPVGMFLMFEDTFDGNNTCEAIRELVLLIGEKGWERLSWVGDFNFREDLLVFKSNLDA